MNMLASYLASSSSNKDSPFNEWEFIGGDSFLRKLIFVSKYPNQSLPAKTDRCICRARIRGNNYLRNINTKEILIVGEKCLQEFLGNNNLKVKRFSRLCDRCKTGHNNRNDNWCNICRGGILEVGRHRNKSFRWVYNNDLSYCYSLMTIDDPYEGLISFITWLKKIDQEESNEHIDSRKRNSLCYPSHELYYCSSYDNDSDGENIQVNKRQRINNKRVYSNKPKADSNQLIINSNQAKSGIHELRGTTSLIFGKYRGKSFDWVYNNDQNYCEWVLRQKRPQNQLLKFQQWLNNHPH